MLNESLYQMEIKQRVLNIQDTLKANGMKTPEICTNRFSGHWSGDDPWPNNISPPGTGGKFDKNPLHTMLNILKKMKG
jgi:hypothetical protein